MAQMSGEIGCGLRVEGRDIGIRFGALPEAESAASKLFANGYTRVEIFDRASGRTIAAKTSPMLRPMRCI